MRRAVLRACAGRSTIHSPLSTSRPPMKKALRILALLLLLGSFASAAERPNVVIILADDQGWGDLSFNGNTNIHTPNVDSLVRDGVKLDRFFVCPVCSP